MAHRPEVVSPTQFSSQLVVKPASHLPESTAAQVAAQAVLVADALLAAAACEQRRRHLQDLVHRLPGQETA